MCCRSASSCVSVINVKLAASANSLSGEFAPPPGNPPLPQRRRLLFGTFLEGRGEAAVPGFRVPKKKTTDPSLSFDSWVTFRRRASEGG